MPSPFPSSNITRLRESATIAVSARAKALIAAGRPVIDLGAGEPDFGTPAYVVEAAHRALDAGAMRYTQVEGILPLRAAVAERATSTRGREVISAEQVLITTGTKQALFETCFSLFGPGDEVLVPTPGWTSYYEMLELARATAVEVRGGRAQQLKVTPDDLRAAATERTRGLILNSPCNPSGAVYSRAELEAIAELARANDWWIVSDEIYRAISYDGPAASMLEAAPSLDRLVVIDGVAKSFAMTGWRIGWAIAPRALTGAMTALQSHVTSNASTPSQHAALAAITHPGAERARLDEMLGEFRRRRDGALALLRGAGVDVLEPQGAFYLYIRVGAASDSVSDPGGAFAARLLDELDVAVVPGSAFHSPEWIRVSYAAPTEAVLEGVRRIITARIS